MPVTRAPPRLIERIESRPGLLETCSIVGRFGLASSIVTTTRSAFTPLEAKMAWTLSVSVSVRIFDSRTPMSSSSFFWKSVDTLASTVRAEAGIAIIRPARAEIASAVMRMGLFPQIS
jgi:hypothetical protein